MIFVIYSKLNSLIPKISELHVLEDNITNSFLSSGTYDIPSSVTSIDFALAGGGGGGAGGDGTYGGGGGAASYVVRRYSYPIPATATKIRITIGDGGAGGGYNNNGTGGVQSKLEFLNVSDVLVYQIIAYGSPQGRTGGLTWGHPTGPYGTLGPMTIPTESSTAGTIPNGATGGTNRFSGASGGVGGTQFTLSGSDAPNGTGAGGGGAFADAGTGGKGGSGFCWVRWIN